MRRAIAVAILGSLALTACGDAGDVTGPETPEPQFHEVAPGDGPDGDYSMYFVDFELVGDFWVKMAQEWEAGDDPDPAQCPGNTGTHADGDPGFSGTGAMLPATGSGYFSLRTPRGWRTGFLWVKKACWFDEWNGGGFPESAWIAGKALVGWSVRDFRAKLVSNGFPADEHETQLDAAEFILGSDGEGTAVVGELHHEDGTSLVQ